MPVWGRKKQETEEALLSTKNLIIKVKKMGMDTQEAEKLYYQAKKALRNRKYNMALEGIEDAKKNAKITYAKGIKAILKLKITRLEEIIKELNIKNLDYTKISELLGESKASFRGGVREYKDGLKAAREGLRLAESELRKFDRVSGYLASTRTLLRRIEEYSPEIAVVGVFKKKLKSCENLQAQGKIESAKKSARKLNDEVKKSSAQFSKARDAIEALRKVISDADVLGANIDAKSNLKEAEALLFQGKFISASKIANEGKDEFQVILNGFKEAKYHVDIASEKVSEARNWGFSVKEAESTLNSAKEALKNHEFEMAITLSKESNEKASNIRERHKRSLELIQQAKDEMERIKATGKDVSRIEDGIKEAEDEFYRGDYSASEDKINGILKEIRDRE
ncbi:MAG: hypothetical protein JSV56_10030 [Methanomassiliicoccales archaeon]|nr:MAG: hypothetical protein JSV56_10030 [Methanomassiliicoccales archaeon]